VKATRCTFEDNALACVRVLAGHASGELADSVIRKNARSGLWMSQGEATAVLRGMGGGEVIGIPQEKVNG